ncbi:MAG: hypothetical protein ACOCWQ_06185, partial [Nanoarchaeota archaeon]
VGHISPSDADYLLSSDVYTYDRMPEGHGAASFFAPLTDLHQGGDRTRRYVPEQFLDGLARRARKAGYSFVYTGEIYVPQISLAAYHPTIDDAVKRAMLSETHNGETTLHADPHLHLKLHESGTSYEWAA